MSMDAKEFFTEYGEANRYTIKEVIGKGSYGVVCSAVDIKTGEKVAIKKINNVFDHVSDATRILREIKLLRLLRHPGEQLYNISPGCCFCCLASIKFFLVGCCVQTLWRSSTSCCPPAHGSSRTYMWCLSLWRLICIRCVRQMYWHTMLCLWHMLMSQYCNTAVSSTSARHCDCCHSWPEQLMVA